MLLRIIVNRLTAKPALPRQRVCDSACMQSHANQTATLKTRWHGLFMATCAAFALSASPANAAESDPNESEIIYEDVDPDGSTENNPEESDILYEDYPVDGLPVGEPGNDPLPIGNQPPGAIPEPGTLALLLAGAAGAILLGRRRSRRP